jgi:hypothetical protein
MAIDINIPSQVKNYANLAGFPATGSLKTIFIAEDTNKTYRWTGSAYVEISASQATAWGAITGTLSSQTDLQNALNAKQATLVSATNIKTINGTTLLGSGDLVVGGGGVTIGTTAITSGTVGRVLFEGTGNVVQESANLFWDNNNGRLGIGTSSPTEKLHVLGGIPNIFKIQSNVANLFNQFVSTDGTGEYGIFNDAFYFQPLTTLANGLRFLNGANAVVLQMSQVGNIQIGTTTDAGFKLDVNGTARVSGQATIASGNSLILQSTTLTESNVGVSWQSSTNVERALIRLNWNTGEFKIGTAGGGYFPAFYSNGSERMRIFTTGNVGINTTTDIASSKLTIESTTQGFLPPRMTTTQKNAIASPIAGLMVYDTTLNLISVFNGTIWI